ncbi:MAG: nucleotidyltransferase domain-containing protein, partial [Myxococcota bacterium]|nr:nucleotidyltransferase domain-containing protein [Myxococcota bacterium]MDW8364198.1 nucleotidyltransferase domain-containing protein [Myxococcales bacterium]
MIRSAARRTIMRAAPQDNDRLNREVERLVEQLKALGAVQIILFGSLARGRVSLFSDIDLLVLFEKPGSARELGRWVYQAIQTGEGVDILAYNR